MWEDRVFSLYVKKLTLSPRDALGKGPEMGIMI